MQLNQEFYKNPACISALASILASSPEFAVGPDRATVSFVLTNAFKVRQLAAVELRKRVSQNSGNLWTLLPENEREEIKAKLPELILAELKYVFVLLPFMSISNFAAVTSFAIPLHALLLPLPPSRFP